MSKRKKHTPHEEEGGEAWLLPYSDLMTLLLAVFIVLFAVSQVDASKAKQMSEEFSDKMMSASSALSSMPNHEVEKKETSVVSVSEEAKENFAGKYEEEKLQKLKEQLDEKLQSENLASSVTTTIDTRGLVVSFNNALLFDSGSAQIKLENEGTLIEVANMINSMENYVRIEGHTDNVPMNSALYPSNWELSSARAASVVQLFINNCHYTPQKLVAVGYGEYRPVADNATPEGRSKNRRIDIIVLSGKYNDLEKQVEKQKN